MSLWISSCPMLHFSKSSAWPLCRTHDIYYIQQFLSLGPVGIWGWTVHLGRSCPVHCGMFSNLPSLYPIVMTVDSTLPTVVTSTDVRHCQMFHGGENQPRLRNTDIQTQWSAAAVGLISFPFQMLQFKTLPDVFPAALARTVRCLCINKPHARPVGSSTALGPNRVRCCPSPCLRGPEHIWSMYIYIYLQ